MSRLPEATRSRKTPRSPRVAELLREEISLLMTREMKDPRIRLASVSAVNVSPDLRQARVMVSAVGDDAARQSVVQALQHAEGFVRGRLNDRLENLRAIPHLRFELDESIAYSIHISEVLRDIAAEERPSNDGEDT